MKKKSPKNPVARPTTLDALAERIRNLEAAVKQNIPNRTLDSRMSQLEEEERLTINWLSNVDAGLNKVKHLAGIHERVNAHDIRIADLEKSLRKPYIVDRPHEPMSAPVVKPAATTPPVNVKPLDVGTLDKPGPDRISSTIQGDLLHLVLSDEDAKLFTELSVRFAKHGYRLDARACNFDPKPQ